jgi:hypothetical protein
MNFKAQKNPGPAGVSSDAMKIDLLKFQDEIQLETVVIHWVV